MQHTLSIQITCRKGQKTGKDNTLQFITTTIRSGCVGVRVHVCGEGVWVYSAPVKDRLLFKMTLKMR